MPRPTTGPASCRGLPMLPGSAASSRPARCAAPSDARGGASTRLASAIVLLAIVATGGARAQDAATPPAPAPAAAKADKDLKAETAAPAAGVDESTGRTLQERIRAVSRRWFLKRERLELEPQFGFTANDALNRAWSFGARLSYHLSEEFAIDVGGGGGFNQPLQDIRVLTEDVVLPKGAQQLGYGDIGVTFSPIYGKLAVMAEQVIHFDGFISTGAGVIIDDSQSLVRPAFELGVGTRLFLSRALTFRADLRNYTYPTDTGGRLTFPSTLILTFGVGIHVPFDFDYSNEIIGGKA